MKDSIREDLTYLFDDDDFATIATFLTPALGDVKGIFDDDQQVQDIGGAVQPVLRTVTFTCASDDVPSVTLGHSLSIAGKQYSVLYSLADGTGVTTLHLKTK